MKSITEVRRYWEQNPVLSFELPDVGSKEFYDGFDAIKREIEAFSMYYWAFDGFRGKKLLDVGCGPGWLTVNYALGGADTYAVDLTNRAVELTRGHLAYRNVSADVRQGNAEELPFDDATFDVVISSGVLHHTPDTPKAIRECWRVLKPGGTAKISLYRKGLLHSPLLFPLVQAVMRVLGAGRPGASLSRSQGVDDFVRQYDGADNPIGIARTDAQWKRLMEQSGFVVTRHAAHYFPKRFFPLGDRTPQWLHRFLDSRLGTMVYFDLRKPATT